jgi:RNA polymerase sigma-70 factor (ECF subfamily)
MDDGAALSMADPDRAIEHTYRTAARAAVATLTAAFADAALAEDAVHDAFVTATRRWPVDGVPPNPGGWIMTTARNRAIDQWRRRQRGRDLERQHGQDRSAPEAGNDAHRDGDLGVFGGLDQFEAADPLQLMFTACHPAIRPDHQVALVLRHLAGLEVAEIAQAFLVGDAAMAKRLTRARYKIRAARIPHRVPTGTELVDRLDAVLTVLYLIYNQGADRPMAGRSLRGHAITLARDLADRLGEHPETLGLLALLLLNESRMPARLDDQRLVLLADQDRTRWDNRLITEGHALVRRCIATDRPGRFQLQAAIQAVHTNARSTEATDWAQVVELYDHLLQLQPDPVVALNRAIAVIELDGPGPGLVAVEALEAHLGRYGPYHAARGEALDRLGRSIDAAAAFRDAAAVTTSESRRRNLLERASSIESTGEQSSPGPGAPSERP